MILKFLAKLLIVQIFFLADLQVQAAEKPFRIGTLAPKNSLYYRQLVEVAETWKNSTGGNAKYTVYADGSQGGETELARRMRIGQLQGALLSVVGLNEIEPSSALYNPCPCCSRAGMRLIMFVKKCVLGWKRNF